MRNYFKPGYLGLSLGLATAFVSCGDVKEKEEKPNFVIIFLDDAGWGDFNSFVPRDYQTPYTDQLAAEGCCYDNFYVPQSICSASRAALLTGCYPERTGVSAFYYPKERGLEPSFPIIAEILKEHGYKTGSFGKWHIGDQPDTRPHARGFDETSGIMYSNDMWKYHPEEPEIYLDIPMHFWRNGEVIIDDMGPDDQKEMTTWFTEHAVDFIQRHKDEPFFLYVPHPMPHVPIYCSEKFEGKSGQGLYADVIMELDWSVGQIMKALKENGLDENTVLIFTSDNGPWISYGNHAGYTPFREAKATSFDGGTRSATIIRYPGKIKAGTRSSATFCSIDIMPTLCDLAGIDMTEYTLDGKNVWDLITGTPGAVNPHEYYAFSTHRNFEALMSADGKWKLILPHEFRVLEVEGMDGMPGRFGKEKTGLALYDLENDPYEKSNVLDDFPDVKNKLMKFVDYHRNKYY